MTATRHRKGNRMLSKKLFGEVKSLVASRMGLSEDLIDLALEVSIAEDNGRRRSWRRSESTIKIAVARDEAQHD